MKKGFIEIIFIFVIIVLLINYMPNLNKDYVKVGKLYISKILAINTSLKEDNNGEYSDYIEIYNGYNYTINLEGYHLSDNDYVYNKWTFPDIEIGPKKSLIVYASGNDYCDLVNKICHTNFKLSGNGEVVLLTDKNSNIISKVTYGVQYKDIIYAYKDGKYIFVDKDGKKAKIKKVNGNDYKIEITEYITHNKNSYYDSYGNYFDFIEIHNYGDDSYSLEGLYLSDNKDNLEKYMLPDYIIEKDEYAVIHCTNSSQLYEDGIYINCGLGDNDKEIIISDGNKIIDKVDIVSLSDDVSYGKVDKEWYYFTTPTPGKINDTKKFKTWGDNDGGS